MINTITTKSVLKYSLLPGLGPRFKGLFEGAFSHVAYLLAFIYSSIGLLPRNHPYLRTANFGAFSIINVVGAAAANLKFTAKNIDQIVIFLVLLAGLVMLFIQLLLMVLAIVTQPALAASMPTSFSGFFVTEDPHQDLALIFLDHVFGVEGIFGSCVSTSGVSCMTYAPELDNQRQIYTDPAFPSPFHAGLHALFQFYSLGLLIIATLILMYFVVTVAIETAQSGKPFGQRFTHVWAPIRIVVAFGLLIPLGSGLNAAQYMTLYAAKYGSGFATNGWYLFNDAAKERMANDSSRTFVGPKQNLVAIPNIPELDKTVRFMAMAATCKYAYESIDPNKEIRAMQRRKAGVSNGNYKQIMPTSYDDALEFAEKSNVSGQDGDIKIAFGSGSPGLTGLGVRTEFPCGEIVIPNVNIDDEISYEIQKRYYEIIVRLWANFTNGPLPGGGRVIGSPDVGRLETVVECYVIPSNASSLCDDSDPLPDNDFRASTTDYAYTYFYGGDFLANLQDAELDEFWKMDDELQKRGWAAAAIWYNKIAQLNGMVVASAYNGPQVATYPDPLENILEQKKAQDNYIDPDDPFSVDMSNHTDVDFEPDYEESIARGLRWVYNFWGAGSMQNDYSRESNPLAAFLREIFGAQGVYDLRSSNNNDVHPLAQLSAIGKSLVDRTIIAVTAGAVIGLFSEIGMAIAFIFAFVAFTAGFVLYYVIPFLPYMYFLFALVTWIKTIFEAMVGVPLWALAHIRIDGQGLPGEAAATGYYLLLEIFLRPILILFGLLGSISIFAGGMTILNNTFDIAVTAFTGDGLEPLSGTPVGGLMKNLMKPVDQFFFTIIYAIVAYIMATASFKLIDQVPNNIMRWMGAGVETFGDQNTGDIDNIIQYSAVGAGAVSGQVSGGIQKTVSGIRKSYKKDE